MVKVYIDHFITNPNGNIEVGYHFDNELEGAHSRIFMDQAELLADGSNVIANPENGLKLALAAWLGVDPSGSDQSLATEFRTEIDMTALVSVRRVLDV